MIKIIIIEDQPIILEGIKVLINLINDFEVLAEYPNGKPFIQDLNNLNADIILTDIDMPEMDGITTTKLALTTHPEMKFIALSMYSDQKYYYEMITAGAKGFVLKQSSVDELEFAIREVHKGGNFFSKELLHSVLLDIQKIENEIAQEKKDLIRLSERETLILKYICQGLSNKEIGLRLCLSIKTIESNKAKLMKKTNSKNSAGLIIWAIKNKIVNI